MPDLGLEIEGGCFEGILGGEDEEELELATLSFMISFRLWQTRQDSTDSIGCPFWSIHPDIPFVYVCLVGQADLDPGWRILGDLSKLLGKCKSILDLRISCRTGSCLSDTFLGACHGEW